MLKALLLQVALVLVAAAAIWPWMGDVGSISVMLGGGAYLLPNAIFVIRLRVSAASGQANAMTFFVGELLKVLATILLLALAQRWFEIHWLAMLLGLFVALKANLFAFLLKT